MGWSGEDGRWSPAGALKLYKPLICTYYILPHTTTIDTPMPTTSFNGADVDAREQSYFAALSAD